jgi:hypothetical protein
VLFADVAVVVVAGVVVDHRCHQGPDLLTFQENPAGNVLLTMLVVVVLLVSLCSC